MEIRSDYGDVLEEGDEQVLKLNATSRNAKLSAAEQANEKPRGHGLNGRIPLASVLLFARTSVTRATHHTKCSRLL